MFHKAVLATRAAVVPGLLFFLLPLIVTTSYAVANPFQDVGKRLALVIGVSDYDNATTLKNPVNDARRMAQALRSVNFEVMEIINPDIEALRSAKKSFLAALDDTDIALLYYAGHSIQIDDTNYLLPTDVSLASADALQRETLDLTTIVNAMQTRAKTKIVVFDACRDNPFAARLAAALDDVGVQRSIGRGAAPIHVRGPVGHEGEGFNTYGSIIAYAAAPGETAADGDGENSPYTKALIAEITRPGREVGQMFRVAAANVVTETRGRQKPEYLVRLTDEVFLSRPQPSDCDYFAIAPYNQVGIEGVEFDAIRPSKAIPACEEALRTEPDHPRYLHNLARTLDSAREYDRAFELYKRSADLGFVPAINNLGVMYLNGHGIAQDIPEGVRLIKESATMGYRLSKVALRSADFSVLFGEGEFRALQRALADTGFYDGAIDGDFGQASTAALTAYQERHGLARNGATLETLDSLQLIGIIPPYELN